jgi:light-regulated signal transduction histidine kinase (bacteriophytochrome)
LSLIGVSTGIVIVFGFLLWNTLLKTAFLPLQNEILERQKVQKTLSDRGRELETANKELESFCYSVSHDLRSPLRGIHGFSTALHEDFNDALDDTGKEHLQRICDAANRMSLLIDVLLEMSRISRKDMKVTHVDLSSIATEILARLKNEAPNRDVVCNVQMGLKVEGDPALLHVLLNNLLSNAWKYSRNQKQAVISFERMKTDQGDVFCVMDNGAGFNMAHANKLFTAFQRLHRQDEFEGIGVGLATVKRIVHRHHGDVWAEAEKNMGAKFYFNLWKKEHK